MWLLQQGQVERKLVGAGLTVGDDPEVVVEDDDDFALTDARYNTTNTGQNSRNAQSENPKNGSRRSRTSAGY